MQMKFQIRVTTFTLTQNISVWSGHSQVIIGQCLKEASQPPNQIS